MTITDRTPALAEDAGWPQDEVDAWLEDAETSHRDTQLDAQREADLERQAA